MSIKSYKKAWLKLSVKVDLCGSAALEAVKQDGDALRYVKDQSDPICLEAVKRNGHALQYVKDQSDPICLEAVKQDGDALRYVTAETIGVVESDYEHSEEEMTEDDVSKELGRKIKFKR